MRSKSRYRLSRAEGSLQLAKQTAAEGFSQGLHELRPSVYANSRYPFISGDCKPEEKNQQDQSFALPRCHVQRCSICRY